MLAVIGHPGDHRALDRDRAGRGQRRAHWLLRLEAAMRQVAMEAHRHTHRADQVHDHEDRDVGPVQPRVPQLPTDYPERNERQGGNGAGCDPVGGLVPYRLDIVPGRENGRRWGQLRRRHCAGPYPEVALEVTCLLRSPEWVTPSPARFSSPVAAAIWVR